LDESRDKGTSRKAGIPDPAQPLRLVTVFERDAAQDQPRQRQQHRQIKRRQQRRIDDRKGPPENHSGHDKPGLVAIPHRRNRAQHRAPPRLVMRQTEQHSDSEIKPVEQHIEKDADGQYGHPEHDHGYSPAGT
jgi:hypothetical protein